MNSRIMVTVFLIWSLLALSPSFAGNSSTNFGGIGIDGASQPDGRIVVRQLVAGGPAHVAGIRVGDIITHVDSKPTRGSDFNHIVNYRLRGKAGSPVLLTVQRQGVAKPLTYRLLRRQLVIGK